MLARISYNSEGSSYKDLLTNRNNMTNYEISVKEHFKCDTVLESFIVYCVEVKTNDYHIIAKRRYSDFEWLMEYLYKKFPYFILPPMPSKRYVAGTARFDRTFIERRMAALEVMMNRLFTFEECVKDERVIAFIKFDVKEFLSYRSENANGSIVGLVQKMVKKIIGETIISMKSSGNYMAERDEASISCFNVLNNRITDRAIMECLVEQTGRLRRHWAHYHVNCLHTAQQLADMVLLLDHSHDASRLLDCAAQLFFNWASDARDHYCASYDRLLPLFAENLAYNERIVRKLRNRNITKNALMIKTNELKLLETKLSPDAKSSLPKANKFDQLTTEVVTLETHLNEFDRKFYPNYQKWLQQRSEDFANCLNVFVQSQISYHRALLHISRNCLSRMSELE